MIKIIIHLIKFTIIGCLIILGLSFYDKESPIYLQNIIFWILVFIPCVGSYESVISSLINKHIKKEDVINKTFQEKINKKD